MMTKITIVGIASVAVVASAVLAPDLVFAERPHVRVEPRRVLVAPHHFHPHPFFRGPVVGFGVILPPVVAYAPSVYAVPPAYYDPAVYAPPSYGPPPASFAPPPPTAPPMPSVIEYPNGRYELRGDGMSIPYKWVWIPNPPPGPPPDAPTAPGPVRHTELYRWTDETGAVHWTDRLDAVPQQYRAQATKLQS